MPHPTTPAAPRARPTTRPPTASGSLPPVSSRHASFAGLLGAAGSSGRHEPARGPVARSDPRGGRLTRPASVPRPAA